MYYSNGNYEAFAKPRKPAGVDDKTAWFVGSGIASLAGAAFLIRDGQMAGNKITILEEQDIAGGALDGIKEPEKGFIIRGGRELESNYECLWELFRSIPSLEIPDASVLDEFYWLNKDDPNYSLQRATVKQGQDAHTDRKFNLSDKAQKQLIKMFLATREEMEGKRINEVFDKEILQSNFWLYWRTMFAFQEWHSALEMKLYLHRFIHHIHGMPDLSTLKFTKYNQYESFVLPLQKWLMDRGVEFQYATTVQDVDFTFQNNKKQATRIRWTRNGQDGGVDLGPNDLVFMTIGSLTESSDNGDQHTRAALLDGPAPAWDLWRRIAAKHSSFGRPDVFGSHIPETKWESATVTTLDARIPKLIQKICKRDPFSGKVVTGGIVTARDSKWLMSWTVNRQPHFKNQPKDQIVVWVYGLFVDIPGDFVKKPLQDCTGEEITQEWLYHIGAPVEDIPDLAANGAKCVPVMMPYVTAFFMPRRAGDRPDVVPQGATNFAFIGQFAESGRDCIFTTEYAIRTGMEAVYQLLGVDRAVPEVYSSTYDVRILLKAIHHIRDGKKFAIHLPGGVRKWLLHKLDQNEVGKLMEEYELV
ncbi:hypothetical protein PV10_09209 [Exophiala mesophila]|uniref:Oleate hydratase n=1 Tax=Exophiala mesophila TaxID=212818 RepID=A0A0D1WGY7_EXOME|nr:uncharacterized protein PV10_09209 [Exophiala mesophila]KIV88035.1 hypothetical protein PV10_09209 [Exophiala mesophila]